MLYPEIVDVDGNIIYKNIPFEYGSLLENLINYKRYFSKINIMGNPIDFYLNRMPILPHLFLFASLFSTKLLFFIISKNIVFFSIILKSFPIQFFLLNNLFFSIFKFSLYSFFFLKKPGTLIHNLYNKINKNEKLKFL